MSPSTQLKQLIAQELEIVPNLVLPHARFVEDLGADSSTILKLIKQCEQTFKIEIADGEARYFTTFRDAEICLHRKTNAPIEEQDAESDPGSRSFLQLWLHRQAKHAIERAEPLGHSASGQLNRVQPGDTVWAVTVDAQGILTTIGRVVVGEVLSDDEAVKRFGEQIYEAEWHVTAHEGTEEYPRWVNLMGLLLS